LTVVVTRPVDEVAALVARVEQAGGRTIAMPLIEIVDVASAADLAAAIGPLTATDWVVVASPRAAERVAEVLATSPAQVAAVGATTAARLRERLVEQIVGPLGDDRSVLVADRQSAEGLVACFPDAPSHGAPSHRAPGGGAGGAVAGRAVVVQAQGGAPTLVDGLTAKGWNVTRIDTHLARPVRPTAREQLAAIGADALVLTSGSQAAAWTAVFGHTTPPIVVAIGPQTARDAEREGLTISVVATDHSLHGLVSALAAFVGRQ
ncbi:MAG: uroporphyrinogen-III synthase, partial [Actinomycetota bacterium]